MSSDATEFRAPILIENWNKLKAIAFALQ